MLQKVVSFGLSEVAYPPGEISRLDQRYVRPLREALQDTQWSECKLELLEDQGLAHAHVRLEGSGLLARIPKLSQVGLAPAEHLEHEAACFRRTMPSGATPRLHQVLPVSAELPFGALLVDEIDGEIPVLPAGLAPVIVALAAIHQLPLPAVDQRAPLPSLDDPLQAMIEELRTQAEFLQQLDLSLLSGSTHELILSELERFEACCSRTDRPLIKLITFDAHPGNFLLTQHPAAEAFACMVDLEKSRYSYPGFDLAHATLYTSTTWDSRSSQALQTEETAAAYLLWAEVMGFQDEQLANELSWLGPLRRGMWLWSVTWCAKWLATSAQQEADWSSQKNADALNIHVEERARHYLSQPIVSRISKELAELEKRFNKTFQSREIHQ